MANIEQADWQLNSPVAIGSEPARVMLAHGEGGRMMRQLLRERIIAPLDPDGSYCSDDAARLAAIDGPLAMTTDSFVVTPLFFPGGDIGKLAVFGTVNDLVVSGAKPLYLSLSLMLEEGLPIAILDRVMRSVADAARLTEVRIVTGDTKVVPRGAVDGMFINTTGIGKLIDPIPPGAASLQDGDELIVTGPIGRHGIAVLCAREELALHPSPNSDCAPLAQAAETIRSRIGNRLRAMRDATRGGVAAVLHEWAEASQLTIAINESDLPVSPDVRGACELLGLEPLHIANEGTMIVAVTADAADDAVAALRSLPETQHASRFGRVVAKQSAAVIITRTMGRPQPLDEPQGAPLPRIC